MKKFFAFLLAAALAISCHAAAVVPFTPADGGIFRLSQGGKLVRVEAFSPVSGGTVAMSSIYSAKTFTNAVEIVERTNVTFTVVASNSYTHAISTNVFPNLSFVDDPGILSVTTNSLVAATTNAWPVFKETIAVTNDIFSGTLSGYIYTNALAEAVYLAPGETLRFTGTATGGFVRLIFE